VIEYLMEGKVAATHDDFKELGYNEALQRISCTNNKECLTHNFKLSRAYDNDTIQWTNYT
jgi:hypothetical protein